MARLPFPADSDAFSSETREGVRHIQSTHGIMPPPSTYLTYAGRAGVLLSDLVEHLRYRTTLSEAEIELAICTSVRAADVDFIWNAHVRLGLKAGVREQAIDAIDRFLPLDDLTADEALIIGYGRELLEEKQVSDKTFAAVCARFGENGLTELTAIMGVYQMNATLLRAVGHAALPDARRLTRRPKD